jgi:hypothetical protein
MLIVPELKVIFIFPPRTGSDTLLVELMNKFPSSFMPYRHMEADGVPAGYEGWRKVGFVRHPLHRLFSLYKYCCVIACGEVIAPLRAEVDRVAASVQGHSFESWVLNNEELFVPKDSSLPILHQLHHIPETMKSQQVYLRPDLGTVVLKFQDLRQHMAAWGLDFDRQNGATVSVPLPPPSKKLRRHLRKYFAWELDMNLEEL